MILYIVVQDKKGNQKSLKVSGGLLDDKTCPFLIECELKKLCKKKKLNLISWEIEK